MRFAKTRLATGPEIHFADHGADNGRPIVFLHGWPDSWFSFSRVAPLLPAHHRSLLLDQRGFGDSARNAKSYAVTDFAADVVALLDALSIEKATVVGHSFGTFVARQVAIAAPHRVDRLVLIGSAWIARNAVTLEVQAAIRDLPEPVPPEFARDFQASTIFEPVPPPFFEQLVSESCKLPARLWRSVFDALLEYDDGEDLPAIAAPTLLIWGERDALFAREDQERLVTTLQRARMLVYPSTGHSPNWERPEKVARDIAAFLSE
jgi:pimeloyl-ACP methyl ester carboxylesterase